MKRRCVLALVAAGFLPSLRIAVADPVAARVTLPTAKLELGGDWRGSAKPDVAVVIERMRSACLADVTLLSDRQPEKLRVDDKSGSYPAIWLHSEAPTTAWITVIVGTRDWCNLAYQFGHEFGHVFCNSWQSDAAPRNPCQWIEEALAEAFSLRGLGHLANAWEHAPPFKDDSAYAGSIRDYRETVLAGCSKIAQQQDVAAGFGAWFKNNRLMLDQHGGLDAARGAVPTMLGLIESDAEMVTDMGLLNRWPERSGVPLPAYLDHWQTSCAERNASGRLPARLRELLAGA
jgi:hypothetical protein